MHPSKKQIGDALAPLLKKHGYKKRALTWHRLGQETIQVFHGAKSPWGADVYTFTSAIYLTALGEETTPPYYRCPIQVRLERLAPNAKEIFRICDFENASLSLPDRLASIVRAVEEYALPWLDTHSTIPALQRLVDCEYQDVLKKANVRGEAYNYLRAIPPPEM